MLLEFHEAYIFLPINNISLPHCLLRLKSEISQPTGYSVATKQTGNHIRDVVDIVRLYGEYDMCVSYSFIACIH